MGKWMVWADKVQQRPRPVFRANYFLPPWRQPRGRLKVSLVNSHTIATRIGWHLWKIDSRFAPGFPPGWVVTFFWCERRSSWHGERGSSAATLSFLPPSPFPGSFLGERGCAAVLGAV